MSTVFVTTRNSWKAQMLEMERQKFGHKHEIQVTVSDALTPEPLESGSQTPTTDSETIPVESPAKKPRISPFTWTKTVARKRKRTTDSASFNSSRASSRQRTLLPDPEPIYRCSRSRSISSFASAAKNQQYRQCWTEQDGCPGISFVSSEMVVRDIMKTYKAYFRNPSDPQDTSFEPHPTCYPIAELEYPNSGASERFILLAPKDKDHYNPIMCLEQSLYTIIRHYLTPTQQSLFGTLPNDTFLDTTRPSSPPLPSIYLPSPDIDTDNSPLSTPPASDHGDVDLIKLFQRAIRQHDGPLIKQTMIDINNILRRLKYPPLPPDPFSPGASHNVLRVAARSWTSSVPHNVLTRIIDETYQRSVGPHVHTLNRYEAFSSEVYGELLPVFTSEIISLTGLNTESLFIDLGSGVGNVVMQASLQSGCRSFGIELMPTPAKIAEEQLEQFQLRCRMWGVSMGEVELVQGDMLTSARVTELLPRADVVLVNNKVFLQSLNEALRPRFLDLKEGAIVVSLKPFVSSLNARLTERNVDDISAIFEVVEHRYRSGSVSWGGNSGHYYLHRVDREGYAGIRRRFEESRAGSSRSKRM